MSQPDEREEAHMPQDEAGSAPTVREDAVGSAPTVREDAVGSAPTVREDAAGSALATMREEPSGVSLAEPGASSARLPEELRDKYRFVSQSAQVGAEGTLFDVVEIATGRVRILKLYHGHVRLSREALSRIQAVDAAHVVELIDFGQLVDGRWYEVQERIDGGDLVAYRQRMGGSLPPDGLVEVVAELSSAIAAFHGAGLAHHDIKPENILARSLDPVDLVLSDFGLAVVAGNKTYYATNRNATIAYQAPETMRQVGGEPRDYWALGLTIAMLATGDVPYAGLNDHGILDQHHSRVPPPIIESIPEGRLKQLCRGLTRFDPAVRWTSDEIGGWLQGADPGVPSESTSEPAGARSGVRFNQGMFLDEVSLADEMVRCWSLTAQTIGVASRRAPFMDELILVLGSESLARLADGWAAAPPARDDIDAAVVKLILTLDPSQEAQFRGRRLSRDLVAAAALSGSGEDREFVLELCDRKILGAWGASPRCEDLAEISERWSAAMQRVEEIGTALGRQGVNPPSTEEWAVPLLAVVARSELMEDWKERRSASRLEGDFVPEWHGALFEGDEPVDMIAAVLLAGEAERIQQRDRESDRKASRAARERRRERLYRAVLRLLGRIAALALIAGPCLEWAAAEQFGDGLPLGVLLVRGEVLLVLLALVLFAQAHYSAMDRRIAEALGVVAFMSIAYWDLTRPASVLSVHFGTEVWELLSLAHTSYGIAAVASLLWSVASFAYRRNEDPPTDELVETLRRRDRSNIKAAIGFTLTLAVPVSTGLLLMLAPAGEGIPPEELGLLFEASPWDVGWAALAGGVWLPLVFAGFLLLARGRWRHRRVGSIWASSLLLLGVIAWFVGQAISDSRIDAARALMP